MAVSSVGGWHRGLRQLGVAALMLVLAGTAVAAPRQAPNSRVVLDLPESYAEARNFAGFQNEELGISYLVQEMPPVAYDELVKGLTPERLGARGFREVSTGRLTRDGDHLLIRARQMSAAGDYAKLIVVLRAPEATVLITANVPQLAVEAGTVKLAEVEAVLAGAQIAGAISRRELYRLADPGSFKPAGTVLGTATVYTRDGRLEPEAKGRARSVFIVAPSLDAREPGELAPFALGLLRTLAGLRDIKAGAAEEIVVDGTSGVLHGADAVHASDGTPMKLVQAVLAPASGGYYRLVGMARADEAEVLLPEFRRMIESFRLVEGR